MQGGKPYCDFSFSSLPGVHEKLLVEEASNTTKQRRTNEGCAVTLSVKTLLFKQ